MYDNETVCQLYDDAERSSAMPRLFHVPMAVRMYARPRLDCVMGLVSILAAEKPL